MKTNYKHMLGAVLLAGLVGFGSMQATADDAKARAMMNQVANPDRSSLYSLEHAFVTLWDAYGEADSSSLRKKIETRLTEISNQYDSLRANGYILFLYVPNPSSRRFYELYAKYGRRLGQRMYGELLLEEGNQDGISYICKAAHAGDARAEYIMAEYLAKDKHGITDQDFTNAVAWLRLSMSHGYAPAYELMAQLEWDGFWNLPRNLDNAINDLNNAINLYSRVTMNDKDEDKGLKNHTARLISVRNIMQKFARINYQHLWKAHPRLEGVFFSYNAIKLSTLAEERNNNDHLWLMGLVINDEVESYRGQFMVGRLSELDIWRVGITWNTSVKPYLGWANTWTTDETFHGVIKVYPDNDIWDDSDVERNVLAFIKLVDTIAHELAHVRFSSRYPKIVDGSMPNRKKPFEGHATNAAYSVVSSLFYANSLSPEKYARLYLSNEYTTYFNWFRNNYVGSNGFVQWDKLDSWEKQTGGDGYYAHSRRPDTSKPQVYKPYTYFGHAFYGFM